MPSHSLIVFADLDADAPQPPSAVAQSIVQAARNSLSAGQFEVALQPMSAEDVRRSVRDMPSGHERLSPDRNLILLGAGAVLAYAPYRSRLVLLDDPFEQAAAFGGAPQEADSARIRLHEALCAAENVITLSQSAFDSVLPLLSRRPVRERLPTRALSASTAADAPVLVVNNDDGRTVEQTAGMLAETFPETSFVPFDTRTAFQGGWKAVVQFGVARSSLPGARLSDAWAGGLPLFQLVVPSAVSVARRHYGNYLPDVVVEHGRSGLRFATREELCAAIRDFLFDPLPARAVARSARKRIDPAAEWDTFLKVIL